MKRSAKTGADFRVIDRIITSITSTNDLEIHSIDTEQAFLQTDKLMEGVNDRYFINPSPGNPDDNNKDKRRF